MKKVVAFLEKYAEWVAMSLACVFLLYMVYAYIVSPDDLRVDVGNEKLLPGDVDPHVASNLATPLQSSIDDTSTNSIAFPVPEFEKQFRLAMSKDRERMGAQYVQGNQFRPFLPGEKGGGTQFVDRKDQVVALPLPPAVIWTFSNQGNSLVSVAAAVPAGAAAPAQPVLDKVEKNWIMCEGKIDNKALAAAWKKALFNANGPIVPPEALMTHFLRVDIERQEMLQPDVWGATTPVMPLAIAEIKPYPTVGDRVGEAEFVKWAESHQVEIIEPTFYPILKGDEWLVSAMKPKVDPVAPVAVDPKTPFDPANPPQRELTSQEKQAVYKYNLKQKEEREKQENIQRKQKMDAARPKAAPSSGGVQGEGGGRRRIGGYAPIPEVRQPGQRYDDAGRPIGPSRSTPGTGFQRTPIPREGGRTPRLVNPAPTMNNNGMIQNQGLGQPFDPTTLAEVDGEGKDANIVLWINDDTVVPGKTYRYRVKVALKNPIYNTAGLTQKPEFETQLAVETPWSEWTEVKAPSNSQYFFSRINQPIGKGITTVNVDVFKREKGEWNEYTFKDVAAGDSIGSMTKTKMDYSTGMTLIDLRLDTREKDWKVLVSDEAGNIRVISFQSQLNDPLYTSLKEKVRAAAAAGPAAAAEPALINPTR